MQKIPVYVNPYDKVHFGPSTVMTLHRFGIFDPDVARRVPTLSPFSAKLTAHLRFQGIPFEPVAEQGVGNAPRGKVPFISVDGVKLADSDLIIGFLKTNFPDPDAGLSDHQRAVGRLRSPGFYLKETGSWSSNPFRLTPCQRFARVLSPPPASAAFL